MEELLSTYAEGARSDGSSNVVDAQSRFK